MRLGLVVGFAAGYYLGAKAGRERYDQIQRWLRDFRGSAPYEKAQAAVELGIERVKQQAEPLVGSDTGSPNGPRG
ncbi:MAG: YtxH domain-containing protein [Acidimicrobiia bacterium]